MQYGSSLLLFPEMLHAWAFVLEHGTQRVVGWCTEPASTCASAPGQFLFCAPTDQQRSRRAAGAANIEKIETQHNTNRQQQLQVRKQTRDLVHLLRAAAGRADHYLFMEDDMLLCRGGAAAIGRMLSKAHRSGTGE